MRKLIETPQIDRLAREGMIFHRALVPNSICGPARATLLTGTYSHINGFYNNSNRRFDSSQPTFVKLLQAAGYQTAIAGKWHLESDPVGFDYWNILPGQGLYYNPPTIENGRRTRHTGCVTDIITDQALDWFKLVRFYVPEAESWELYDREKDPSELRDCSKDPAYDETLVQLKAELERLRVELKVPKETPRSAFGNAPIAPSSIKPAAGTPPPER